jgi:hypothetical protein
VSISAAPDIEQGVAGACRRPAAVRGCGLRVAARVPPDLPPLEPDGPPDEEPEPDEPLEPAPRPEEEPVPV